MIRDARSRKVGFSAWRSPKLSFCRCSRSAASARRSSSAPSPPRPTRCASPSRRWPSRSASSSRRSAPTCSSAPGRGVRRRPRPGARSPSTRRAACARSRTPPTASASSPRCAPARSRSASSAARRRGASSELVAAFLRRHPNVSVRLIGRNSSAIADRVRRGELEAGLVLLPIDDDKLDVRPIVRDEVLYVSADPERTRRAGHDRARSPPTPLIFYDAESADDDPIRRQLAERAQALGVRLRPRVEVELNDIALRLVADGHRRHLPAERLHARAVLPRRSAHGVVPARALRHVRDRHPLRRAPLARRPRAARGARDAHARGRRRVRPVTLAFPSPKLRLWPSLTGPVARAYFALGRGERPAA